MKLGHYATRRLIKTFDRRAFKLALGSLFLVILTLYIGRTSTAFSGFPKGYDAFDHLSLSQIIKENFPYLLWNPYWDGGVVLFPRNYPPLFHFGVGLLSRAFSLEVVSMARVVLALSVILTVLFIFLTIWRLTKKILPGIFGALFFLASSTVWCYLLVDGLYPRVLAMMTVSLVILGLVWDRTYKTNKTYMLVVFSLVLAFLTHFLSAFLASAAFLVIIFFWKGKWRQKIWQTIKIFLPVLGLTAFYYLPLIVMRPGRLSLVGEFRGGQYQPWEFLSLLKQGYPGLPFLSIPLGLFVLVLVFLLRGEIKKKKKEIYYLFFGFGGLSLACLFYVLGAYKEHFFYGIYPQQFLLPTVYFLSLFLGLGLFFLVELKVIKKPLFFVVLMGLGALALVQSPQLEKLALDQSLVYPRLTFQGIDEEKLFRFAHRDEVLGGAFNFYSQTLQTRGYFEPGIIYYDYHWWFEGGVFRTAGNPQETKFLLDWYGVRNLYLSRRGGQAGISRGGIGRKLSDNDFTNLGDGEFEYQKAQPIILATQAPVLLSQKDEEEYLNILKSLAKKGIDSQKLIPIWDLKARPGDFSTRVLRETETETEIETEIEKGIEGSFDSAQDKQKAEFINPHKRVIELEEKFTGVLLKEAYYRNWRARIGQMENAVPAGRQGKWKMENLRVYLAGPGMMYVSLPKDYQLPAKVVFEYQMSWVERLGWGITLLTVIGLISRKRINNSRFNKSIIQLFEKLRD